MLEANFDRDTALEYHNHALGLSDSPIGGMANGGAWADIGSGALNLGNYELAQSLLERALTYPSFYRIIMKPRSLLGLAELAQRRSDFDVAQGYITQARTLADESGMKPFQGARRSRSRETVCSAGQSRGCIGIV